MSKFNILSQVNATADLRSFDRYQLTIGLKDLIAIIPSGRSAAFEAAAEARAPQTLAGAEQLVKEFDGELQ